MPLVRSRPDAAVAPGRRLAILIVEDNPDAAESFAMLLRLGGHDVRVAANGFAALELVERFAPDVAFLDIGLPGIDGYELSGRLRARASCRRTVLVAMTGYGRDEDKQRAIDAGFDRHLTKPVEHGEVARVLASVELPTASPASNG
jgi:CheY-like chemotaxis protein